MTVFSAQAEKLEAEKLKVGRQRVTQRSRARLRDYPLALTHTRLGHCPYVCVLTLLSGYRTAQSAGERGGEQEAQAARAAVPHRTEAARNSAVPGALRLARQGGAGAEGSHRQAGASIDSTVLSTLSAV